ncbi:MAG: phospho-N-acetylmuramoyl-pentapeptide-transferase [Phycisphaera sp.]|nr:phospho-N-acetylmuramoyl-pentapeptide-transferase [Phycisphaera sp.]
MIYLLITSLRDWLTDVGLFRYLQVFQWPEFRTLCATLLSFLTVVMFGKRTIRWLLKQKIGDNPEFDNADLNRMNKGKGQTPTMGGILISGAIFMSILLLADISNFYVQMALICLVWFAALGAADDWLKLTTARRSPGSRDGLKSWEKIIFQFGIALVLGFFIHYYGSNNPQSHILSLPFQRTNVPGTTELADGLIILDTGWKMWVFGVIAVLVITGSSNAVNLTDGMDGLASGVMWIVSFAFVALTLIIGTPKWATHLLMPYIPGSVELAVVAGAMAGACMGFLWWNCHPAQVFMGDTGSLPLGGLIGYIAVVIRQEWLLAVIGGILVMEAMSVILQVGYFKLTGGSRIFKCTPIHHHFHLSGWTEQQVVTRFWMMTALLAVAGLMLIKLR